MQLINRNYRAYCLYVGLCFFSFHFSSAIVLDFGTLSVDSTDAAIDFGDTIGDTLDYGVVANDGTTDIFARITTKNTFVVKDTTSPTNAGQPNGSIGGDVRLQVRGDIASYTLGLYQDASYTALYNPGVTFDWSFMFYDIDSNVSMTNYDQITFFTSGTFSITDTSTLVITADGTSTTFSGEDAGRVTNVDEADTTFTTQDQADVSVVFSVVDLAEIEFDYNVGGNGARLAFIDGGNLTFSGYTTGTYSVGAVPEPSASTSILGLFSFFYIVKRRRKAR